MFLYELALQLQMKSSELVERAEQLGMPGLGATSQLDRDQVAHLQAALGGAAPGAIAPPPMAFAPPGPGLPMAGAQAPYGPPSSFGGPVTPGGPGGPDDEGMTRAQVVMIGAAAIAVIALFVVGFIKQRKLKAQATAEVPAVKA